MRSELSIEVCHLYVHRMTEETVRAAALQAASWLTPLLALTTTYSIAVLLDDYTRPRRKDPPTVTNEGAQALVVRVFEEVGLPIDYVVMEAACAQTVGHLKALLAGAGDVDQIAKGWLSNGEPARHELESSKTRSRYAHRIALDVQLWTNGDEGVRWACPMVAAWWQLMRLGGLNYFGLPLPAGTWSRPDAKSLEADRTLTVLNVDYLEVEHAVQSILRHVAGGVFGPRLTDRMSYLFLPEARPHG